ncbi:aspartyl protease family protein 1-like [Olea europaea var. sylvestris]|uniref:aspartyl protease family protein 1-like n=1 Tax=Olea europaea var. sylvestris TaxID=158386 RepID=UPI000C1D4E46|nr:aspartyl protease family protein 1-like [Olea europaea var. sylvestris]
MDSNHIYLLILVTLSSALRSEGFGTFAFDIHHRYSDPVHGFLNLDGLPEKGSLDYYSAMAQRDQLIKAHRLAVTPADSTHLSFFGGNETYKLSSLGSLHYAIVTVGTPALTFLVALDTGSDLFWLPCDCTSCSRSLNSTSGKTLELNIYSPSKSSTGIPVPCNSTKCGQKRRCSVTRKACAYQEIYLSSNTSTTGILVDDVLHLATDDSQEKVVDAPITLGCGIIQTGDFLVAAAPNGLFGLGMDSLSIPSILASKGLAANSFSMCFGPDGIGRMVFGDKGSSAQKTTPFNLKQSHPTYNITVTQIIVGENTTNLEFTAIFDSGTSFTYLNDPAYSVIAKGFDSQVSEPPYQPEAQFPFDYCYELSANQESINTPDLNLTMKGGDQIYVKEPIIVIPRQGGYAYCLAIVKSRDIDIIGQNFMTGYRIVFDREELVLGWTDSDCYDSNPSKNGSNTLPVNKNNSTEAPSPSMLNPQDTLRNKTRSPDSAPPPSSPTGPTRPLIGNSATRFTFNSCKLVMAIFSHYLIILFS